MLSRSATWTFRADTPGPKTFAVRGWSENAGEITATKTVQVVNAPANLVPHAVGMNPPAPSRPPGTTLLGDDTVQNTGTAPAGSSKTRYYLSTDAVKSADDTLLTGTQLGSPSGGRGEPFRRHEGDDPLGHPARQLFPSRLRR